LLVGLSLDVTGAELAARRQVVDIPVIKPSYTKQPKYNDRKSR
ncbi:hypothetical protein AAKU52_002681, partial [Pedobacter sp. CG_S7]